jgi:hypothetical protein
VGTLHEGCRACFLAHFECNWKSVIGMKSDWYKRSREKLNMYMQSTVLFKLYRFDMKKKVNKPKLV